jgi:hypothetical protein
VISVGYEHGDGSRWQIVSTETGVRSLGMDNVILPGVTTEEIPAGPSSSRTPGPSRAPSQGR